ncbi:hypothetical protein, partial [Streptomyces sp. C3-3]|uniref:hypothetical protein n=1 Tax=Streptomyces sp. C3-3 TaxID=2824901 RepID=UPI001B3600C0
LGITEDWYDGKTPPAGLSEEDLNEWRAEHEADSPRYFRDGSEVDGDDEVLIPVSDPVPHYQRGRTYIEPRLPGLQSRQRRTRCCPTSRPTERGSMTDHQTTPDNPPTSDLA